MLMQKVRRSFVQVSADERRAFLRANSMPADVTESYIWLAFQGWDVDTVELFTDELGVAAGMARHAGLNDLAGRLENGGDYGIPEPI